MNVFLITLKIFYIFNIGVGVWGWGGRLERKLVQCHQLQP